MTRLATTTRAQSVRVLEDDDNVFPHAEYDFNALDLCSQIFCFEDGMVVQHWDNLPTLREALSGKNKASRYEK